jgi:hypothetical protein
MHIFSDGEAFVACTLTVDGLGLHSHDPELKCQTAEWYSAVSTLRKLHRNIWGTLKVMYFVFFSHEEVVFRHAVQPHTSVSDTYCVVVLRDDVLSSTENNHSCCEVALSSFR